MKVIGWLIILGLVLVHWKLILCAVVVIAFVKAAPVAYREVQQERAVRRQRAAEIAARADQQVKWWNAGDERAIYGPSGRMGA